MTQTHELSTLEETIVGEPDKLAVSTSAVSGEAEEEIHLPGPSLLPVLLAASLLVLGLGFVLSSILATIGAVMVGFVIVTWARPARAVTEAPMEAAEDVGHDEAAGSSLNWWGMIAFLLTEAVLFAYLISAYLYLRTVVATQWPPEGTERLHTLLPTIATGLLLSSSIPIHWASSGIRKGNNRQLQIGLGLTILLGAIFMSMQLFEYATAELTPQTNVYGSVFYTLTGFHGAHVLVGLGMLVATFWHASRERYSAESHFGVRAAELYWHFVDVVWVILFVSLYLL